jgi:putative lipoic acid-binding regulatory protein
MTRSHDIPPEQSLIEYPCRFPIKVMGSNSAEFVAAMTRIAQAFEASFDPDVHLEQRPSRAGNYMGLTVSIHVHHREQLDEVYRTYTTHPMVKYVL